MCVMIVLFVLLENDNILRRNVVRRDKQHESV